MKTTKRSKMLLSSIAMLLVALVALGSATYAWYIVNREVTASTATVNAAAAEGLVIQDADTPVASAWGSSVNTLTGKTNVDPMTIKIDENYSALTAKKFKGAAYNDGTRTGSATETLDHSATLSAVGTDTFYVASTNADISTVTMKVTTEKIDGSYLVMAIYVDNVYVGAVCSDGTSTSVTEAVSTTPTTINTNVQAAPASSGDLTIMNATMTAASYGSTKTSGTKVQYVLYADGENQNCKTSAVVPDTASFSFSFTY